MALPDQQLQQIDQLDEQITQLLIQRAALVQNHVQHFSKDGEAGSVGQVAQAAVRIDRVVAEVAMDSTLSPVAIRELLRHVSSTCLQAASAMNVAFLGPEHSYSHLASLKYFGDGVEYTPVGSIPAVFQAVARGDAMTGLVPIENSTDGRIVDTLGMFVRQEMKICGEVLLPIHHNLLSKSARNEITQVHSKPQALSQCRDWLAKNLPNAELHEISSTTAAAELAARTPGIAAVASVQAGRKYGLDVVNANIEDNANNITRFAVLGREQPAPTGDDKTSLLFQINHAPGALADVMNVFKQQSLNLTWIESFPAPETPNEYLFFVELTGHREQTPVAKTIERLAASTQRLDVLGSYPRARL